MCDPITAVTIGGAVLSAGASLYEGSQAASQIAATRERPEPGQRPVGRLPEADSRPGGRRRAEPRARKRQRRSRARCNKISPQAQEATQSTEQQRLNTLYNQAGSTRARRRRRREPAFVGRRHRQPVDHQQHHVADQPGDGAGAPAHRRVGDGEFLWGFVRGPRDHRAYRPRPRGQRDQPPERDPPGRSQDLWRPAASAAAQLRRRARHVGDRGHRQSPREHRRHAGGLGWAKSDGRCGSVGASAFGGAGYDFSSTDLVAGTARPTSATSTTTRSARRSCPSFACPRTTRSPRRSATWARHWATRSTR